MNIIELLFFLLALFLSFRSGRYLFTYHKTARDLATMLTENRIRNRVLQELFLDLYNDYLHVAIDAMRTGVAA